MQEANWRPDRRNGNRWNSKSAIQTRFSSSVTRSDLTLKNVNKTPKLSLRYSNYTIHYQKRKDLASESVLNIGDRKRKRSSFINPGRQSKLSISPCDQESSKRQHN